MVNSGEENKHLSGTRLRLLIAVILRVSILLGLGILLISNVTKLNSSREYYEYLTSSFEYKYGSMNDIREYPIDIEDTRVISSNMGLVKTELGNLYNKGALGGTDIKVYRDVYGRLNIAKDINTSYGISYVEDAKPFDRLNLAEYGLARARIELSGSYIKGLNISANVLLVISIIVGITTIIEIITTINVLKGNKKLELPLICKLLSVINIMIIVIFCVYNFMDAFRGYSDLRAMNQVLESEYDSKLLNGTIYCRVDYSTATVYEKGELVSKTNLGPIKSSYLSNTDTVVVYTDVFGDLCPIFKEKVNSNVIYIDRALEIPKDQLSNYVELVTDEDRIMYLGYRLGKVETKGLADDIHQDLQTAVVSLVCFALSATVTIIWGEHDRRLKDRHTEDKQETTN